MVNKFEVGKKKTGVEIRIARFESRGMERERTDLQEPTLWRYPEGRRRPCKKWGLT